MRAQEQREYSGYTIDRENPRGHVMLINMEGEETLSLHEPIGLEGVASRLMRDHPDLTVNLYDTQPELIHFGKVDTDKLAEKVRDFANKGNQPLILGIGAPIGGWLYAESLLLKLEQQPPSVPVEIVLGNAIATYTDPKLIKAKFPSLHLISDEGEEMFSKMVSSLLDGMEIPDDFIHDPPNLDDYVSPYRAFTQDVIDLGGSVKIETGRGCVHGACTFCSRHIRGGKDFRSIPETKVLEEYTSLLDQFNMTRFELTDEEAFGDLEATTRLVSILKSANLPKVPFTASLRVETLIDLDQQGLLTQLQELGLDKIFIGVEGGSDEYLKQIAKSQKMSEVTEAITILKDNGLDFEMGFITFSWRMSFDMLRKNIEFLSQDDNADHVSALLNNLMVRPGSLDEVILRKAIAQNKLSSYDPDVNYDINTSCYVNVPFLDEKVGFAFNETAQFARYDAKVYYALKSLVRTGILDESNQIKLNELFKSLKKTHLEKLRSLVNLETEGSAEANRKQVIQKLADFCVPLPQTEAINVLRREAAIFLTEEEERENATPQQVGSLLVLSDDTGRILLTRPRGDSKWSFPGGNVKIDQTGKMEDITDAAKREAMEEIGILPDEYEIIGALPKIVKMRHKDHTTGNRSSLTLHHTAARLRTKHINILDADHEIADYILLSPQTIHSGRIDVRDNVREIISGMLNSD